MVEPNSNSKGSMRQHIRPSMRYEIFRKWQLKLFPSGIRLFAVRKKGTKALLCMELHGFLSHTETQSLIYEGWNFNSGNYLFTTDIK